MKREDKNQASRQKIMESALREFSQRGYGLSSVNTICSSGDISKGVLYHYFKDKDEIYLTCVQACFDALCAHLENSLREKKGGVQAYFDARSAFFAQSPQYRRLFCDAVISSPQHLAAEIKKIRADFDALNLSVLTGLLDGVSLRGELTKEQVIEFFGLFQDFVNARWQMAEGDGTVLEKHEEIAGRSLDILLYGVVDRGENNG